MRLALRLCRSTRIAQLREQLSATQPALRDFVGISSRRGPVATDVHYLQAHEIDGQQRKVFYETYGCQMNSNDTELVRSIMHESNYTETDVVAEADVHLIMTCSIREKAEDKIWSRIRKLRRAKRGRHAERPLSVGILGCMAERLKNDLLTKAGGAVDVIAGPDAYRDLPRLLAHHLLTEQQALNVMLSWDETYADITPLRVSNNANAFVSIMRGCDNMCTYCVVPYTRGRERSRPVESIVNEVRQLSEAGVRQVTLLGQNVNSYCDMSSIDHPTTSEPREGFTTVYKPKQGGRRFVHLLDAVAQVDPNMRIRYTAAHPKDFPKELLQVIKQYPNICKQVHLPAQSGNSKVLEAMGRGYTREAYLDLAEEIRATVPGVSFTSDFIAGFCGETQEAHEDTLLLIWHMRYSFIYSFAYSMRERTRAHRRLVDDVPADVKSCRATELLKMFQKTAHEDNQVAVGTKQLVLIDQMSRRNVDEFRARNDAGISVILSAHEALPSVVDDETRPLRIGDYAIAEITGATSHSLRAIPLYRTDIVTGISAELSRDSTRPPCDE